MNTTDTDDAPVPEAEPLPPLEAPDEPEPATDLPGNEGSSPTDTDAGETDGEPPPLPPLLETGASTLATTGAGIYTAAGPAGLVAAAGIAGVAGAAYGVSRLRARAAARGSGAGPRAGQGARAARSGLLGALGTRTGTGAGRSGRAGAGGGSGRGTRSRSRSGSGRGASSGAGAMARRSRTATGTGAGGGFGSGLLGRSGSGTGAGRTGGSGPGSALGFGKGPGGGGGLLGRSGGGSHRRTGTGSGTGGGAGGGLSGRGSGTRSALSGLTGRAGAGSGRRPGARGGLLRGGAGLFGGSGSGSGARRARRGRGSVTAISDPAVPVGSGRGRARRLARAGWDHPRTRRVRQAARRGTTRARRGLTNRAKRMGAYLRKRRWALRLRGWARAGRDWWGRMWDRLRGRASDPRYGPLKGWQLTAAAASIGALGAGTRRSEPRVLTGRIIGTAAPTPGDAGPLNLAGRTLLAITAGEGDEPLAPEAQRVKDAADELRQALADMGGSQVGMLVYEQGLKQLGPALSQVADGFQAMSRTAEDEQPLAPEVLEFFGTIQDAVRGSSEVAEEMPGLFRAAHEVELQRLENPRRGEHKWDISQQ